MKYRRLVVENFRPFYGSHELEFSTDPQRPVTLIFGANGGGKTTLLTAMYWCLYGSTKVDPNTSEDEKRLFNNLAQKNLANGKSDEMSVELELAREDIRWRIKRSLKLAKDANGNKTWTPKLELKEINDGIPTEHKANQQFYINQLLDEVLGEFFFHAAETLQFPFKNEAASRRRLRDCLYKIGGQGELDSVVTQAGKAVDVLRADRARVAQRQDAHSEVEAEMNRINREIETLDTDLAGAEAELGPLEQRLQRSMAVLENVEMFAPKVEALRAAQGALHLAEEGLKRIRGEQAGGTSDLWKVQAQPLMGAFFDWFGPRVGEFPRIVNQNLILHMEKTGRCICGHEIGADELEEVRAMAGEGDDTAARRLTGLYDLSKDWGEEAENVKRTYEQGRADLAAAVDAVDAAKETVEAATADLAALGVAPQQELAALQANVAEDSQEVGRLRGLIEEWMKKKLELEHERGDWARRNIANASEELKVAEAEVLAAEMVKQLASSLKDTHAALCRPQLETWMNAAYWADKVSRKIRIDEDWNVSTYDESGEDEFDVGGGGAETTLLTYAFAAATAKLIPAFKSAGIEAIPENEQVQEVETIPLVVDAPFSSLGVNYQRTVADKLPQAANQLVLFNEATPLKPFVTMGEAGKIGKLYSVKFTGELKEEAQQRTFEFGGEEITYLVDSTEDGRSEVVHHTFAF